MIPRPLEKSEVVGLLDVGTSKISCAIVERAFPAGPSAPPAVRVLGVGHQRSHGIKAGLVVHLDQAEAAVRAAVGQAERMADVTLEEVIATASCGRQKSQHFTAHAELASGKVAHEDLDKLAKGAREFASREGRILLNLNRVSYALDGAVGLRDPHGLVGRRLSATWHAVTADAQPLHNLALLVDRAYLGVRQFVPASFAAALSATTSEERSLGVTCIHFGAGVIDISAFSDGQFLFTDTIPVGGGHLTYDIARILTTPLAEAERIKVLYGTLVGARSDDQDLIQYSLAGELEGEAYQTTKAEVHRILYPRVESQLCLVRDRLVESDRLANPGPNIVITGGASQMIGLADLAVRIWRRPVRAGGVPSHEGLPRSMHSPAFSATLGMAMAPAVSAFKSNRASPTRIPGGGYLDRMEQWLRASF